MIELFILAALLFGGLLLGLKILFFFLGLIFSGIGFFFRFIVFGVLAFALFPVLTTFVGAILSSGTLITLLVIAFLFVMADGIKKNRRERRYSEYRYDEDRQYYRREYR